MLDFINYCWILPYITDSIWLVSKFKFNSHITVCSEYSYPEGHTGFDHTCELLRVGVGLIFFVGIVRAFEFVLAFAFALVSGGE